MISVKAAYVKKFNIFILLKMLHVKFYMYNKPLKKEG